MPSYAERLPVAGVPKELRKKASYFCAVPYSIHFHIQKASSGQRSVEEQEAEHHHAACQKSDPVESGCQDQKDDPHELHSVSKLKIGLGVVGHGHKRHVEHDFRVEPAGGHGKFSQHQGGDHT